MIIVRLYKDDKGIKKYVSKVTTKNRKMDNKLQVNLTENKKEAMIFETTEQIVQFQFFIDNGKHGIKPNELNMEREEIAKTFEDKFGEDDLKEGRVEKMNFLAKKDFIEEQINKCNKALVELTKIDISELSEEAKAEMLEVKATIEQEKDFYLIDLNNLMKEE